MKYILLVFLFCASCSNPFPGQKELNSIRNAAENRIVNELHLEPFGKGVSWPGKLQFIAFDFNYQGYATISEARKLLVAAVDIVVETAKNVEGFEQYLMEAPFTEKNVALSINFENPNIIEGQDRQIERISIMWGKIKYKVSNADGFNYDTIHEEPYSQALGILRNTEKGSSSPSVQLM